MTALRKVQIFIIKNNSSGKLQDLHEIGEQHNNQTNLAKSTK